MWYEEYYMLDDWEEEPVSDPDEFDRRDIYSARIAASAAPPRNDSVNERLRCRGPPGVGQGAQAPADLKNKKIKNNDNGNCASADGERALRFGVQSHNHKK